MKNLSKILTGIMILTALLMLSGCTSFNLDAESLLDPPSLTDEQAKLNDALSDVIGEDYKLKYPSNGSYSSAFMFFDIDADDSDEALAFYSIDEESTRMNILKQQEDGSWLSVYEAAGSNGDVDTVQFLELGDGGYSIVVKWSSEVGVYSFASGRLDTKYRMSCDGIITCDMSGDGFDDVVMFSGSYIGRTTARILYLKDGLLTEAEGTNMTAQFDRIYSYAYGDIGNGEKALFIDSNTYDNIYLTEIISLSEGVTERRTIADIIEAQEEDTEYHNLSVVSSYGKRGTYARNTKVGCMDIDGDGIIEFPVEYRDDTASEDNKKLYYLNYMKYNGTDSQSIWTGFADADSGFMVELPETWCDDIQVSKNKSSGEFVFSKIYDGNEILRIRTIGESEYQDIFNDSYLLIREKRHTKYYVVITTQKSDAFYIDFDTLSENFRLI